MTLTASTMYECLESHASGTDSYKLGEIRRGDGVIQGAGGSPDGLWIAVGSSEAAKRTQRIANGLSNTLANPRTA